MSRREYKNGEIALLHFDFPYYGENGDGLRDEIGNLSWSAQGNAKLVGTEAPVAQVVEGTPKFGYRCLQTAANTDYIKAEDAAGFLDIDKAGEYEFECFARRTGAGNIATLYSSGSAVLTIAINDSGMVTAVAEGVTSLVSSSAVVESTWTHILFRISGGTARLFLNGGDVGSGAATVGIISADEIRLGGLAGQIDEVRIRNAAGSGVPTVPAVPYKGIVDIRSFGGFGNGSLGDVEISGTTGTNVNINTTAILQDGSSSQLLNLGSQKVGMYGAIVAGDKVMIHVSKGKDWSKVTELGKFSLRTVATVSGNSIILDEPIQEFDVLPSDYYIQVVKIPQFKTLVVKLGVTIRPEPWDDSTGGGIAALAVTGNCRVIGNVVSVGTAYNRVVQQGTIHYPCVPVCHAMIPERFFLTGNVFLLCGGTLTVYGYLGNDWDGSRQGGAGGAIGYGGSGGGSGYGGGGGSGGRANRTAVADTRTAGTEGTVGYGSVGGRGEDDVAFSGGAGRSGGAPGLGGEISGGGAGGGVGAAGYCGKGEGGDGGDSGGGDGEDCNVGYASGGSGYGTGGGGATGSTLLVVAKDIAASISSFSCGGAGGGGGGGATSGGGGGGGGGTGFCAVICNTFEEVS